jgi:hypothetical protein
MEDPKRANDRNDMLLPICVSCNTDAAPLVLNIVLKEKPEPSCTLHKIDSWHPIVLCMRTDKVEPKFEKSSIEYASCILHVDLKLNELPMPLTLSAIESRASTLPAP